MKKNTLSYFINLILIAAVAVTLLIAVNGNRKAAGQNRVIGTQIALEMSQNELMVSFIESRIQNEGLYALNQDLYVYVNHMIAKGSGLINNYNVLFENVYEPMLLMLSDEDYQEYTDQIMKALDYFHQDIIEIHDFADEKCKIILERNDAGEPIITSGDYIRYADLINPKSNISGEFNDFVINKYNENIKRMNTIRNG